MFGRGSASFIVFTWTLTLSRSSVVRGEVRVIGDPTPVRAHVGDEVLLPCRCDEPTDLRSFAVEWSRTELRPDPADRQKKVRFVHVHTDHSDDDLDMKLPDFVNRTKLSPEKLATGVASLLILNVALSDSGTYKCFIPKLKTDQDLQWTLVTLVVESPVEAVTPTLDPGLDPRFHDGDSNDKTDAMSKRTRVIKVSVFVAFGALCSIILALYFFRDQLTQIVKNKKLPQNEAVCERGDLVPSERGDSAPVNVEDVNLLIAHQS